MSYRVKFFDEDNKLICWYSTRNKNEAYQLARKSKRWYTEVEHVVTSQAFI